jgi:hypothetical protein
MIKSPEFKIFLVVVFLLLLGTRIPMMMNYFTIDNVNLAYSLEKFDPRAHQPQPPGYPLFVLFARAIHFLFHDAWRAFAALSILASALSLWLVFLLGRRMFSAWAGAAGACLLLVNPVFWHASLEGPLRPHLAFFSLLAAYCCWRCWNGEKKFAMWGAIALGIGGGFRPDILVYLFPLWLISSWIGTRSWRTVLSAVAVMIAIVAVWTSATIIAMGGFRNYYSVMFNYADYWSRVSAAAPGSSLMSWLRQKNRLFVYNALAVIGWIWAVPVYFFRKDKFPLDGMRLAFFVLWIVPGVILQLATHFSEPGHTLFSVTALCLIGGCVLASAPLRNILAGAALALNVMIFFNCFALAKAPANKSGPSLIDALRVGASESSISSIRYVDDITRETLAEIKKYAPLDGPSIIITTDSYVDRWFMNWRIGRYYLPDREFVVLYQTPGNKRAEKIMSNKQPAFSIDSLKIPVFQKGRIFWLLEPDGPVYKELAKLAPLQGGSYVFYVDVGPDSASIVVDGFEIAPVKENKKQ